MNAPDRVLLSNMLAIRRGEETDLPEISAMQSAAPEAAQWDPADYLAYDLRVAVSAGRVSGFLVSRSVAPGEYEILNLVVSPDFRRKGVASGLLRQYLAGINGVVYLEVRESNTAAQNLYKLFNFKEVDTRSGYYSHPLEAAIVMKFHSC